VGSGDNSLEQIIQSDLRGRGVDVDLLQMELGAFLVDARAGTKRFDALVTGIPGDLSLSHLESMFASAQQGGALDYAGFHTPALDALFDAARRASSPLALRDSWRVIDAYLAKEAPASWLYHATGVQGVRRVLAGVEMDLRGELVALTRWHLATDPPAGEPPH
jgi:peptide/nickel transport system substrate-binding protein